MKKTELAQWNLQVKRKFSGALAEPLPPILSNNFSLASLVPDPAKEKRHWDERELLVQAKRQLVLKEYGIDGHWSLENAEILARRLLREFVPGFDVANPNKKVGRTKHWTWGRESVLLHHMKIAAKRHPSFNEERLAAKLQEQKSNDDSPSWPIYRPWPTFCKQENITTLTLLRQYQRAKKTIGRAATLERIFAEEQAGQRKKGEYDRFVKLFFSDAKPIRYR